MAKKQSRKKAKKIAARKPRARKPQKRAAKRKPAPTIEVRTLAPIQENKLVELLSPLRQIDLKLQRHLQDLPKNFVLLALIKVQEYSATNIELIKFFVKKKIPGVFVTVNKPIEDLAMDVPEDYLKSCDISFVDCISKMSGAQELKGENFYYIEAPNDLVELSVAIENIVQKTKSEEKFVVIDSISTLLIYNKRETVEKFVHSIAGKMRVWKVKGIFIMVESQETKSITETLGQFCDHVVEIE